MRLSFIVPVYRTERFLPRCVESILAQTEPELELILVDDGSPDRCPEICDGFAARDPRVRVIHQPNSGVVAARNQGIAAARGDYICFVDSDDSVTPDLASALFSALDRAPSPPDVVLFSHRVLFTDHEETETPALRPGFYSEAEIAKEILPHYISDRRSGRWWHSGVSVCVWGKAFRTDYLRRHPFRDSGIALSEDAAMVFECIRFARSAFVCPQAVYDYNRANEASVTRMFRDDLPDMFARLFAHMKASIGGDSVIDAQLNDYFAWRILRAVNIHVEYGQPIKKAAALLKEGFSRSGLLDYVTPKGLPLEAGVIIRLLKKNQFLTVLLLLRHYLQLKKLRFAVSKRREPSKRMNKKVAEEG